MDEAWGCVGMLVLCLQEERSRGSVIVEEAQAQTEREREAREGEGTPWECVGERFVLRNRGFAIFL